MSKTLERVAPNSKSTKDTQRGARSLRELREVKAVTLPALSAWVVAGIMFALNLIFHWSILTGDRFLWEDFIEQEFPFRTLAATSLAHGSLPHWDPYIFAGMPFLADIQVAFWYPANVLQSLFVSNGYLSPVVMEWFILLHYTVAGLGMFWFAKRLFNLDDWSALFAGVASAFSGFIVAQAIHQMIVYQMALFPFVALLFWKGFDSWKYSIAAGVLLGVSYLAGHPQSTLYLTFLLGCFAIYELVWRATHRENSSPGVGPMLRAAVPVVLALGIFAIQYLPSQELADLSRRDVITYEKSVDGSLGWGNLLTLVLPRLFGVSSAAASPTEVPYWHGPYYNSWETAIYIGIFPLFFGLLAAITRFKKKYVALFGGMALFAVLFALGDNFFLYRIFFALPFFNKLRTPARMMMVFSFTMSALAGLGLKEALKATTPNWGKNASLVVRAVILLVWALALLGVLNALQFQPGIDPQANQSIGWSAGLAAFPVLAFTVITLLFSFMKLRGTPLALSVIGVTLIELFTYGMGLNAGKDDPRVAYRSQEQLIDMLKSDQSKEISRARTRMGGNMLVKRNQGAYDKLQLIEGYNPLVLQRVSPETADPEASADLMNIKHSIVVSQAGLNFVERPTKLPRAKMYYKAEIRPDEQAKQLLKQDSSFDYRNTILLEESPTLALGQSDPAATAQITVYSESAVKATVNTAANGMLFFSEVYYPAWKAYVDGKPAKLYRAFTSLRAVEVPAGQHTVEMRYESNAFQTGSTITLATLLLSIGGLVFFTMKEKKRPEEKTVSA